MGHKLLYNFSHLCGKMISTIARRDFLGLKLLQNLSPL